MKPLDALEYLSEDETKALLLAASSNARDNAIIQVFLCAGLRFTELPGLNIDSIDWENKILRVGGQRARDIPISSVLFDALSAWSRERLDNNSDALFVTLKGAPKRISSRGIDKLLRKYGLEAGIQKHVNAQLLRNTFGVRLLASETSIDNAAAILGLADPKSINRYLKAAKDEKEGAIPSGELEKLDTRLPIVKNISKLLRRKHKTARVIAPPSAAGRDEITIGRADVLSEVKENLSKGLSTLLVGAPGIGKSHLLKVIEQELSVPTNSPLPQEGALPLTKGEQARSAEGVLFIDSPTPVKQFLHKLCDKYCPDWSQRLPSKSRASAKEIVELLCSVLKGRDKKDLLLIDNLDSLKSSDAELLLPFFEYFTILAAACETPGRLKELWWKFRRVDLPPLDKEASKELIKHLTSGLTIADYELLETRIISISNGLPLAIVEMVGQVKNLPIVKKEDAREVYHEAGIRYRDWTAVIIVLWSIATSSRFINLGAQSFEGYILAVLGMAALVGGIRFLRTR